MRPGRRGDSSMWALCPNQSVSGPRPAADRWRRPQAQIWSSHTRGRLRHRRDPQGRGRPVLPQRSAPGGGGGGKAQAGKLLRMQQAQDLIAAIDANPIAQIRAIEIRNKGIGTTVDEGVGLTPTQMWISRGVPHRDVILGLRRDVPHGAAAGPQPARPKADRGRGHLLSEPRPCIVRGSPSPLIVDDTRCCSVGGLGAGLLAGGGGFFVVMAPRLEHIAVGAGGQGGLL